MRDRSSFHRIEGDGGRHTVFPGSEWKPPRRRALDLHLAPPSHSQPLRTGTVRLFWNATFMASPLDERSASTRRPASTGARCGSSGVRAVRAGRPSAGNAAPGRMGRKYVGFPRRIKRVINVMDSTTIKLVANCMNWARHRRRKVSVKFHMRRGNARSPGCSPFCAQSSWTASTCTACSNSVGQHRDHHPYDPRPARLICRDLSPDPWAAVVRKG